MSATAKSFIGLWQGERRAGFAKITLDLQSVDNAFSGMWMTAAGAIAVQPSPAITTPMAYAKLNGETLTSVPTNSPTMMGIRLTSNSEAVFGPIVDPNRFDGTDPDTIKAIERHQIILRKTCG